jgi:hypothetical protein
LKEFTPEARAQVAVCTGEELTLGDLQQAQHPTQERIVELMGVERDKCLAAGAPRRPAARRA